MFGDDLLARARAVIETCEARGWRLVTAESCTGGLIAACLTEIPGSSNVFDRGIVTYSNAAKHEELAVNEGLFLTVGAVSEEVAREMAERAVYQAGADIGVACTGIAGPGGGSDEKPVGLVHLAAARKGGRTLHRRETFGDLGRDRVRLEAVRVALDLLAELIESDDGEVARGRDAGDPAPVAVSGGDALRVTFAIIGFLIAGLVVLLLFLLLSPLNPPNLQAPGLGWTLIGGAIPVAAILAGVWIGLGLRRRRSWRDIGFVPVRPSWIVLAAALGLVLVLVVGLLGALFDIGPDEADLRYLAPEGFSWVGLIGGIALFGFFVPLAEETYFRGVLYRWMRSRWRVPIAAPASALVFALTHPQYAPLLMLVVAGLGVILALAYEHTRSLWPPVALHGAYNSLNIVLVYVALA